MQQINRRKVFQACQATTAAATTHALIANTLPGLLAHIDRNGAYQRDEESIRNAMSVVGIHVQQADDYYTAVVPVIDWMEKNNELPKASSPVVVAVAEEEAAEDSGAAVLDAIDDAPTTTGDEGKPDAKPTARKKRGG